MTESDTDILRRLAGRVADIAQLPIQAERRRQWMDHNALRPGRPMVYMAIHEMPWGELAEVVDEVRCRCQDPQLRTVEADLRQRLFVAEHLHTDHVVDDVFWVEKRIEGDGYGLEVREQTLDQGASAYRSHHYEPVLREPEDVDKIAFPEVHYDRAGTESLAQRLEGIFGDLLPVRICGKRSHTFNSWDTIVTWTGVQEVLMDLVLRPEYCHAIVRRLTDATLARMDQMEAAGLLDAPNPKHTVGSGCAGHSDELGLDHVDGQPWRYGELWGSATSQIFGEVSPEMHAEFAIDYENETLQRCGLVYYGCCEPLHNKMAELDRITNLRKVSISPWCDTEQAVANATRRYVFSHKPNPAVFAGETYDAVAAEAEVRHRLEYSDGMNCEIIAKDISTARHDPQRLIDWTAMAMRLAKAHVSA